MKLYKLYFSPTGGTKKIADVICGAWKEQECETVDWDLFSPDTDRNTCCFSSEDICVVAVPSFGGRVPGPALERLGKLSGNGAKAVLLAVYGNRDFDDTLLELKDTLDSAGFFCAAAIAAVAQHSIMPEYGAGRPDEADREELVSFAARIHAQLENQSLREVEVPGNRPYRAYNGVPLKPKAGRECSKCGKCVRECPVHAIPAEHPETVDKDKCISCMHCIVSCPQGARHNDKLLLLGAAKLMKKSCSGRKKNKLFLSFEA